MPQMEQPTEGRPRSRRLGTLMTALAAGFAGGLLAPLVYPAIASSARPATKKVMKAGIAAIENARVVAAELGEQASDLFAEAWADYERDRAAGSAPNGGADPVEPPLGAKPTEVVSLRGSGREVAD